MKHCHTKTQLHPPTFGAVPCRLHRHSFRLQWQVPACLTWLVMILTKTWTSWDCPMPPVMVPVGMARAHHLQQKFMGTLAEPVMIPTTQRNKSLGRGRRLVAGDRGDEWNAQTQ